jgi:hypothetical protein
MTEGQPAKGPQAQEWPPPSAATSKLSKRILMPLSVPTQRLRFRFLLPLVTLTSHAMGQKKKHCKTGTRASVPRKSEAGPFSGHVPKERAIWPWICLGLILLFMLAMRIRLLPVPLERDEGEFAYAGQLILEGIPPYQLACNVKLPGIYAAYGGGEC